MRDEITVRDSQIRLCGIVHMRQKETVKTKTLTKRCQDIRIK